MRAGEDVAVEEDGVGWLGAKDGWRWKDEEEGKQLEGHGGSVSSVAGR